jgi:ferredoxin-type protein NapG
MNQKSKENPTRRDFIKNAGVALTLGAVGFGAVSWAKQQSPTLLRPPGALPEEEFLAACIRCGLCVTACPFDTLHLAPIEDGAAYATPYLEARETPCYLCRQYEALQCTNVCPTGALQPVIGTDNQDIFSHVKMGVAVINTDTCLAWNNVVCRACWHACPFPDDAIGLDMMGRAEVYPDSCVGCGLCVHACLTDEPSITVDPEQRA